MKHARADYDRIQDPEGKIREDEPVFLIRAQDALASMTVEAWADFAEQWGASVSIVLAARVHAKRIREWQTKHGLKIPDAPADVLRL